MNEWKTVRLGDLCEILNGYAFKSDKYVDSGIRVIRITNVQKGFIEDNSPAFYPITEKDTLKDYELHENDLLISLTGNVGRVALLSKEMLPAALNQRVGCIRIKDKNLLISYLFTFLNSDKFESDCIYSARGIAQKNMSTEWLKNYFIPLPPIEVQIKIANNLNTCAKIIKKHSNQLNNFDLLIKSRFIEMFGDNPVESGKWEVETLADVCSSVVRGPFGSALKKDVFVPKSNNTVKVYEQKHAIQKSANIGTYYISQEKYEELKRFECKPGDFIMSCSGTMGEFYQLPIGCEKGIINQALCKFSLNNKIEALFFLEWMKQSIHNLETKGSGIQNVAAVSFIKQMPVFLPPLTLQNNFATFVQQIDKSKFAVQKSLEKTEILYKSLMQRYFA